MRAVRQRNFDGLAGIAVEDVSPPDLGPGQVLIDVRAAGVNFADLLMTQGLYQSMPALPFTLGLEVSGIVRETHPRAEGVFVGDKVLARVDSGGFAEQVVASDVSCSLAPRGMSFEEGAAFPIAYGTAHMALALRGRLHEGETVLIHGAAGGLGFAAVQVAKALGAVVIATATGGGRVEAALEAGADHALDLSVLAIDDKALNQSQKDPLRDQVKELSGGGVNIVFDPIGGALLRRSLRCAKPFARILTLGFASGDHSQIPANIVLVKNLDVMGVFWGAYDQLDPDRLRESNNAIRALYEDGFLKPRIDRVLPLDNVVEALRALKNREAIGKIVLSLEV